MTTPSDSRGARYGRGGVSSRLAKSRRGDPRDRRAAQAARTDHELGQGMKRDEQGRATVDVDALAEALRKKGLIQ